MPNVDRECVTHHYACDCREARFKKMERVVEAAKLTYDDHFADVAHTRCVVCTKRLRAALSALDGKGGTG